jgi:iron complex outermembrane recepter protein
MKVLIFLIICFSPILIAAQTTITTIDKNSKAPIPGVLVKIQGQPNQVTDENGQIEIDIQSPRILTFLHISFETLSFSSYSK